MTESADQMALGIRYRVDPNGHLNDFIFGGQCSFHDFAVIDLTGVDTESDRGMYLRVGEHEDQRLNTPLTVEAIGRILAVALTNNITFVQFYHHNRRTANDGLPTAIVVTPDYLYHMLGWIGWYGQFFDSLDLVSFNPGQITPEGDDQP